MSVIDRFQREMRIGKVEKRGQVANEWSLSIMKDYPFSSISGPKLTALQQMVKGYWEAA